MNNIRIQLVIYVLLIGVILYCFLLCREGKNKFVLYVRSHLMILVMMLFINTLSFGLSFKKAGESYHLKRQSYDGTEKEYSFLINDSDNRTEFDLKVAAKRLKPKEAQERMDKAFGYLDEHLKGENESLERITKDLDIGLPKEEYPFDVEIIPADYMLVNEDGIVRNEQGDLSAMGFGKTDLISGIESSIKIILWYGELKKEKSYAIRIYPAQKSEALKRADAIEELYKRKELESQYDDAFEVPANYNGVHIERTDSGGISPYGILVAGFVIIGLLLLREAESKRQQVLIRKQELLYAYPWFVNELVLLLGAGMQVKNIFALLVNETSRMKKEDHRRYLIDELKWAGHGFEIGMSEQKIYYELGRRLQLPCYIKIMTLLEQNVTKGSRGITAILEQEERSALLERMNLAKKRGEEAGTKLLGPMILLLLIIMLIIMIPAFLSFTV